MTFTVFSYNATVLLIEPNPTQPKSSHVLENATQPNPTQPNPWMDQPTSISESDRIRKKEKEQWNVVLTLSYTVSWCVTIKWEESQASVSVELIPRTVYRGSPEGASFHCNSNCCVQSVMGLYMADVNIFY